MPLVIPLVIQCVQVLYVIYHDMGYDLWYEKGTRLFGVDTWVWINKCFYTVELFGLFSDKWHAHTQIFVIIAAVISLYLSRCHSFEGEIGCLWVKVEHHRNLVTHIIIIIIIIIIIMKVRKIIALAYNVFSLVYYDTVMRVYLCASVDCKVWWLHF